jgi:hypothetical protein
MARPTLYDEAYCDAVVEFLKDGYSLTAFAGSIGVCRATVFNWMEDHPEFLDSVKRGQAAATLWWEKANRTLAIENKGNATACIFGLKNRATEDWRDVKATEISGPNGGAIAVAPEAAEWTVIDPPTSDGA